MAAEQAPTDNPYVRDPDTGFDPVEELSGKTARCARRSGTTTTATTCRPTR